MDDGNEPPTGHAAAPNAPAAEVDLLLMPWYAVRVRALAEDKSRVLLDRKGIPTFLPKYLDCRPYRDRVKKVQAPLFPGYLFCKLDVRRQLPVLSTPGVSSILSIGGKPAAIDEDVIQSIERVVSSDIPAIPWPFLKAGDEVTILHGSLAGIKGFLIRARGADRLVLSVQVMASSISVEIDRAWVRPLKHTAAMRTT